jgi:hypothetical protein
LAFDNKENHHLDGRSRAERDLADMQDEMAGRSTGRPARFFTGDSGGDTRKGKERKEAERAQFMSALQRMMADPVYAERYKAFDTKLRQAEESTVAVLMILNDRIDATKERLDEFREQADTLPGGTRVYRTADGEKAYTEDGRLLSGEEMESVAWSDDAPTWEEFEAQRQELEQLEQAKREVLDYQEDVLDPARERMNDPDDPISLEEIDGLEQSVEKGQPTAITAYLGQGPDFTLEEPAAPQASRDPAPEDAPKLDIPSLPPAGPGPG